MTIQSFRVENFRCLEKAELEADSKYNLIYGANASGKTSLLEALAYLGRGKSFRGAPVSSLIRHGQNEFVIFGKASRGERVSSIGVRNSREGLEVRIDGDSGAGVAGLAEALPLQIIDPDIHSLVSGGPEARRRYLDWVAFHVEHEFLTVWRRFRRALKQRNAALRAQRGVDPWTVEFVELGLKVDEVRRRVLDSMGDSLSFQGSALLLQNIGFEYRSGWGVDKSLEESVAASLERDLQLGSTQVGPHRADLSLIYDERQARRLVSRGQQKLLACSMILAATARVQEIHGRPLLLLLDDPAAELDRDSLQRLLQSVFGLGCQVVATALEADVLSFPSAPTVFHVEHGVLSRA